MNYNVLKLENQLCFPLYAVAKELTRKYRPFLSPLGLTYTQYVAMMVLWEEGQVSVRELGERLCLDSGTLTPMLKNMESNGLIRRNRSTGDNRVMLVTLTADGEALKERAVQVPGQIAGCVDLTPAEAVELYRLLYKILAKLREETPHSP